MSTCRLRVPASWWVYYAHRVVSFLVVVGYAECNTDYYHYLEKRDKREWSSRNGTRLEGFLLLLDNNVTSLATFATVARSIRRNDITQSSTIYSVGQVVAIVIAVGTVLRATFVILFQKVKDQAGIDDAGEPPNCSPWFYWKRRFGWGRQHSNTAGASASASATSSPPSPALVTTTTTTQSLTQPDEELQQLQEVPIAGDESPSPHQPPTSAAYHLRLSYKLRWGFSRDSLTLRSDLEERTNASMDPSKRQLQSQSKSSYQLRRNYNLNSFRALGKLFSSQPHVTDLESAPAPAVFPAQVPIGERIISCGVVPRVETPANIGLVALEPASVSLQTSYVEEAVIPNALTAEPETPDISPVRLGSPQVFSTQPEMEIPSDALSPSSAVSSSSSLAPEVPTDSDLSLIHSHLEVFHEGVSRSSGVPGTSPIIMGDSTGSETPIAEKEAEVLGGEALRFLESPRASSSYGKRPRRPEVPLAQAQMRGNGADDDDYGDYDDSSGEEDEDEDKGEGGGRGQEGDEEENQEELGEESSVLVSPGALSSIRRVQTLPEARPPSLETPAKMGLPVVPKEDVADRLALTRLNRSLLQAAREGRVEDVKMFLDRGADLEAEDGNGQTALSIAATKGYIGVAALLIDQGAEIDALEDEYDLTPLHFAAWKGHAEVVDLLLANDADMEAEELQGGWTPLSLAVMKGHKRAAKLLIRHGANLEARDSKSRTPLLLAAARGREGIVRLLLSHGANWRATGKDSETALNLARMKGHPATVKVLLGETGEGGSAKLSKASKGTKRLDEHLLLERAKYFYGRGGEVSRKGGERMEREGD
ncbi:Ankyrin-2 [Dactylella cylindrospora]|nr:Ankyrin-2 [Dactylella cylindrospora]